MEKKLCKTTNQECQHWRMSDWETNNREICHAMSLAECREAREGRTKPIVKNHDEELRKAAEGLADLYR